MIPRYSVRHRPMSPKAPMTHKVLTRFGPQTHVLPWVSGEQLRAVFENVVLAEYHCRYDWRNR
jgi:hypothetical protein